jgi:hypothetical protein
VKEAWRSSIRGLDIDIPEVGYIVGRLRREWKEWHLADVTSPGAFDSPTSFISWIAFASKESDSFDSVCVARRSLRSETCLREVSEPRAAIRLQNEVRLAADYTIKTEVEIV